MGTGGFQSLDYGVPALYSVTGTKLTDPVFSGATIQRNCKVQMSSAVVLVV